MRIIVHDFAGHPFQVQLSRELANRGHDVMHVFPTGLPGPKGKLGACDSDSERLRLQPVALSAGFRKYSLWKRFVSQRKYARDLRALIDEFQAEVVLSGNTPLDIQGSLLWHCKRQGIGFVHWVQDVYCRALEFFLRRRFGSLAGLLTYPFRLLEKAIASRSNANVVIAEAFKSLLEKWRVPEERITVIENWAPLDELPQRPRRNAWNAEKGLAEHTVFLYSGTLGFKHRPDLLYKLAQSLDNSCRVVVITEGFGRDYLLQQPRLDNLVLLEFQPYERLPEVLASADVLLATLEPEAGQFAVPSKILTYLCAGRAILIAAPHENLASSIIQRSGSGMVISADDETGWVAAGQRLSANPELRATLAKNAREYAEKAFDIHRITDAFEQVLRKACAAPAIAVMEPVSSSPDASAGIS